MSRGAVSIVAVNMLPMMIGESTVPALLTISNAANASPTPPYNVSAPSRVGDFNIRPCLSGSTDPATRLNVVGMRTEANPIKTAAVLMRVKRGTDKSATEHVQRIIVRFVVDAAAHKYEMAAITHDRNAKCTSK